MSRPLLALSRSVRLPRTDALVAAAGVVIALGLAAGCGGKVVLDTGSTASTTGTGPGTPTFSCDFTTGGVHLCEAVSNATSTDLSALESACSSQGGTASSACSDSDRLGVCSMTEEGLTASISYYAGGGIDASTAQQACTSGGGTWTAG